MKTVLFSIVMSLSAVAFAKVPVHGFTPEQSQKMAIHNQQLADTETAANLWGHLDFQKKDVLISRIPFAEYDQVGYVLFNDVGEYDSLAAKKLMAKNMPKGVTLVVFTGRTDKVYQQQLFDSYAKEMANKDQLKIVYLPGGSKGFWARDGIPVPAWTKDVNGTQKFTVVDARYYHNFEADREVSQLFMSKLVSHNYYHEGGNFLANEKGECFVVDNQRTVQIPDLTFREKYGCQKTIRFPHIKGIGHIDESVKLIDADTAITDSPEYAEILKQNGIEVIMVPRPENKYETYVNSLYVNGTLFLPIFKQAGDAEAIALYESFGYKVVALDSRVLSNYGLGSIHCITMAYPPVPFNEFLNHVGGKEVVTAQ